jgi:23S rRNA (cytosine1962-C5)-methyltransferase
MNEMVYKELVSSHIHGIYGVIVVDPPSFQKKSVVAKKDYSKIIRRLPALLAPRGLVLLCLNAPELTTLLLQEQASEAAPELEFVERLTNPSTFQALDSEPALKVLVYQIPEDS